MASTTTTTATTTTTKPAILIIPGAWHPPSIYTPLLTAFNEAHFDTVRVATLPSLNNTSDPINADCKADTLAVRTQLLALINDGDKDDDDNDDDHATGDGGGGRDVVLLAHSYGGLPAGGAACGMSTTTRASEGLKGGVVGLVYMSAFVVPEGESLVGYLGGKHAPYCLIDQPSAGLCTAGTPSAVFFNDIHPSSALYPTTQLESQLLPHAIHAFESPAPPQAWALPEFTGRFAFLRCTLDQALPPFLQDMFVEKSGVRWSVRELRCGHSGWASMPGEVVRVLEGFLEGVWWDVLV